MVLGVSGEALTAFTAFLSGIGTVLTGFFALWWERRRSRQDCEDRIAAMREGIRMRDRVERGEPMEKDEGGDAP